VTTSERSTPATSTRSPRTRHPTPSFTPDGALHGRDGVKQGIAAVLAGLPDAQWSPRAPLFADGVLFLERAATAGEARVEDGATPSSSATASSRAQASATPC